MQITLHLHLSDAEKLRADIEELKRATAMAEAVLEKLTAQERAAAMLQGPKDEELTNEQRIIAQVLLMADKFTSSELYGKLPTIPRSVIKETLRKLVDSDQLFISEAGEGSRPTTYSKIAEFS